MPSQADRLMALSAEKNMIDKDEYPQTAEIEARCVQIIADLWHAPAAEQATGCSTTGSSEAVMLGGLALKWRWRERMRAAGRPTERPNLVAGINVQVCWEKFCRYWDVEPRLVPMDADRFMLDPAEAVARCDENTIGVAAILGSTFDGRYEPVAEIAAALDELERERGLDIPIHVDAASGGFVAPFIHPELIWDFRLPRVASINASGHKYGLVYPGVGWALWRDREALPQELIFDVNYLGGHMPTFALNFSRPGSEVLTQYLMFASLGRAGYRSVQQRSSDIARRLAAEIATIGPYELISDAQRPAGVRLRAEARGDQLHRVRCLRPPARARLAGTRLHLPGQPRGPLRVANRRARRDEQRDGGPAAARPAPAHRDARGTRRPPAGLAPAGGRVRALTARTPNRYRGRRAFE